MQNPKSKIQNPKSKRESQPLSQLRESVLNWLEQQVPLSRVHHTLRVEQMAIDLARHHHLSETKSQLAALMHDLAKYFKPELLLQMATSEGLEIDEVFRLHPHLLHADVGAIVARQEFGIEDEEILAAIANHTLGRPGMSPLSCVVFLADSLEPARGTTTELETLRQVCHENLYQAVGQTCDYSIQTLIKTRRLIHPRAILTRNWALQQVQLNVQERRQ